MAVLGRDELAAGQSASYPSIKLSANVEYTIIVQSDDPTVAFDVNVFDENDNNVSTSSVYGAFIGCQVTPRWTGLFTIVVTCVRGYSAYSLVISP
jgi:hypothetical protein